MNQLFRSTSLLAVAGLAFAGAAGCAMEVEDPEAEPAADLEAFDATEAAADDEAALASEEPVGESEDGIHWGGYGWPGYGYGYGYGFRRGYGYRAGYRAGYRSSYFYPAYPWYGGYPYGGYPVGYGYGHGIYW